MSTVSVRYIVNDVDAAIAFYCGHLGFHEDMHPAPAFAMLSRGELRLVLSAPNSSGSNSPAFDPAGKALPSRHSTASAGISQIIAARFFNSSTTFSAACVAAMPVAKVTRLPPVRKQ